MGVTIGHLNVRRSTLINARAGARVAGILDAAERLKAWFGQGHTLHVFETEARRQRRDERRA